jgi:cytochrome c peroxidase
LPYLPPPSHDDGAALARIGGQLFFDQRLSADATVSCATCHQPARRFADGHNLAVGIAGKIGTRNAPSLYNVAYATTLFWDGRVSGLQAQAKLPLLNPFEHGMASESALLAKVVAIPRYRAAFSRVNGHLPPSVDQVTAALAAYERTLLAGNSPFDRYEYGGEPQAMTDSAVRGLDLFRCRAGCATCHMIGPSSALFTDGEFHASPFGIPMEVNQRLVELTQQVSAVKARGNVEELNALIMENRGVAALGRFIVTMNPADIGLFRTPSLRNVTETAPYLHDGSIGKLEDVVDAELYSRSSAIRYPIVATATDKEDLLSFLLALRSP